MKDNDIDCPACGKVIGERNYDKKLEKYKIKVLPGIILTEAPAVATRIQCICGHMISLIQGSVR